MDRRITLEEEANALWRHIKETEGDETAWDRCLVITATRRAREALWKPYHPDREAALAELIEEVVQTVRRCS